MDHEVIRNLRAAMKAAGFDALVALSQDNVTYTAGFLTPSQASNRFRRTITIIASDAFSAQIVVNVEENLAREKSRFNDIRAYNQFTQDPADVLADALEEAGVGAGRIAIELDYMPAQDYIRLKERLPRATFLPCKDLYFTTRMYKTAAEIAILRKVGELTDRIAGEALRAIRPGMTEKALGQFISNKMMDGGCDGLKYQVGSGVRSGITNCMPTDKPIEKGDVVRIEILGEMSQYRSNVTRTAVVGEPTDEQKKIWDVMIGSREACKAIIKPGLPVADLYRTYVSYLTERGIQPTLKFLGHGIGQTIHEEPYITDSRDVVMAPNITFTMEPLYMMPGRMGFHVSRDAVRLRDHHRQDHSERRTDPSGMNRVTIAAIETFAISLPLRRPHTWAGNFSPPGRSYVVLKLTLDDGTTGWGETQALKDWGGEYGVRSGESCETVRTVVHDLLAPLIIGEDVARIANIHAKMDKFVKGYPYAKAAIDVALHDALGKRLGVPVYQLLGGLVREAIPLAHSIGLMDADIAVAEAQAVLDEGVTTLKIKVGVDAVRDLALVKRMRQALGPSAKLRVDANQGYQSWKEALRVTRAMAEWDIWYMEQPCEGLENMARVAQNTDVPIMADESAWNARDVLRIIEWKAAEMLSVYYTKPGGLMKAKTLLAVAEAAGLACDINGSGEMGIGNAANLHLAASSPAITLPGTIPITSTTAIERTKVAGRKYLDDIIRTPFIYRDGCMMVPHGPGLGIEVDEDKLRIYAAKAPG